MPILLRAAIPQDAQAIAEIIEIAFHEEANSGQIQRLIASKTHFSYLAEIEKPLGFIDGFLTITQDGTKRLELDLLAVHPDFMGRGIGKQLIRSFSEHIADADLIRTLVAVDNSPMHHAMMATGYQLIPQVHALYVSSENSEKAESPQEAHLIPVETFTYSGIWMEGKMSKEAIQSAQYQRGKRGFDVVGAVISNENKQAIAAVQQADFDYIKNYQWWFRQKDS